MDNVMVLELVNIQMVTNLKVNGSIIRNKETEFTLIALMTPLMAIGEMEKDMEEERTIN